MGVPQMQEPRGRGRKAGDERHAAS
jgi:hypothetical protein